MIARLPVLLAAALAAVLVSGCSTMDPAPVNEPAPAYVDPEDGEPDVGQAAPITGGALTDFSE